MKSKSFDGMVCSIADVLAALGDKWGTLIVRDLLLGISRYDDLQRSTGVTNTTLAARLKELEQSGILERRQYQSRPNRYEYVLTAKGNEIGLVMQAMVQVGDHWNVAGREGPPLEFVDSRTGRRIKLAAVDAETGEFVNPKQIAVRPGPGADDLTRWRLSNKK